MSKCGPLKKVPNISSKNLIGKEAEWKQAYEAMLSKETNIHKQEIFEMLNAKCEVIQKRNLKHGKNSGHEWSPLMIQFCIFVRFGNGPGSGMSKKMWNFIAEAFNLPPNRTLMRYAHSNSSLPDGPCMQTILQMVDMINELTQDEISKEPNFEHPVRYVRLFLNSLKVNGQFF